MLGKLGWSVAYNKHEVTEAFVRLALTGRRESETAQAIRREYPKAYAELEKFLNK